MLCLFVRVRKFMECLYTVYFYYFRVLFILLGKCYTNIVNNFMICCIFRTYAHVHVKGTTDIEVLEEELNGLVIDDKKLLVLSVDKLLAEHTPSRILVTSGRKFN